MIRDELEVIGADNSDRSVGVAERWGLWVVLIMMLPVYNL